MHKLLKLPDEILRGEPPASVGHREVRLGRPLPLRSASESLGGLPSYSPPCLANPKNRAELAASHTCLAIILPLIIPLFLSHPLFSVDEDLSLTKPQGDLFSQSWSNFSDFNFLYTTLSPPSSAEPQWVYVSLCIKSQSSSYLSHGVGTNDACLDACNSENVTLYLVSLCLQAPLSPHSHQSHCLEDLNSCAFCGKAVPHC